jgi:thiol:disulfide interchange protein DsbD
VTAGLLPPERAFAFSARALDERTLEARFVIARGYYLYRDKIRFSVEPARLDAAAVLPRGQMKTDEFFGRVETYRTELVVRLPLERAGPGEHVRLRAESQGCADVGVCYPPQAQEITLVLPAAGKGPGQPVDAQSPRKSWFN